jgi:hypothetical protein
MASERVGDMTREELIALINEIISEHIGNGSCVQKSDRPISEVLESIRKNRYTPPPGTPSVVDMLREDRDR